MSIPIEFVINDIRNNKELDKKSFRDILQKMYFRR